MMIDDQDDDDDGYDSDYDDDHDDDVDNVDAHCEKEGTEARLVVTNTLKSKAYDLLTSHNK